MLQTKVIVKANGGNWQVSANGSSHTEISGNDTFTCTGSKSGDVDVSGDFFNDNIIISFEMNNPWIGCPWAAVGQAFGDSGWKNDRTNLDQGESHIYTTTIYTDDSQYDFKTKVVRLNDTDTKNFEVYPGV